MFNRFSEQADCTYDPIDIDRSRVDMILPTVVCIIYLSATHSIYSVSLHTSCNFTLVPIQLVQLQPTMRWYTHI